MQRATSEQICTPIIPDSRDTWGFVSGRHCSAYQICKSSLICCRGSRLLCLKDIHMSLICFTLRRVCAKMTGRSEVLSRCLLKAKPASPPSLGAKHQLLSPSCLSSLQISIWAGCWVAVCCRADAGLLWLKTKTRSKPSRVTSRAMLSRPIAAGEFQSLKLVHKHRVKLGNLLQKLD